MRTRRQKGFTLLEMTMVLLVLLVLISIATFSSKWVITWRAGSLASETLRTVYMAQRSYLADNPTAQVANLTQAMLLPYLPNSPTVFPTVTSLTKTTLTIKVNVSPPYAVDSSGARYDPSGGTTDSLWDVGE